MFCNRFGKVERFMKIDLHMHSNASDGTDEPRKLIQKAAEQGFEAVALTDHDTVDGLDAAVEEAAQRGVRLLPGIELSAGGDMEVHVLGYGIKKRALISQKIAQLRAERGTRANRMVEKLHELGVDIAMEQVLRFAKGAVGRPHVARALVEAGVVQDMDEAFRRYIGREAPAYVSRVYLSVEEAVQWIRTSGGVAVLAHPRLIRMDQQHLPAMLEKWKAGGLMGVEAYHSAQDATYAARMDALARHMGLLVTGGSDYHGDNKTVKMGQGLNRWAKSDIDFYELCSTIDRL